MQPWLYCAALSPASAFCFTIRGPSNLSSATGSSACVVHSPPGSTLKFASAAAAPAARTPTVAASLPAAAAPPAAPAEPAAPAAPAAPALAGARLAASRSAFRPSLLAGRHLADCCEEEVEDNG